MKKLFLRLLLVLCMAVSISLAVSINASAEDTALTNGANIESGTTYTISNATELGYLADIVNVGHKDCSGATFKLTANINLNGGITFNANGSYSAGTPTSWTPIGNSSTLFNGTFDGDHRTVSGIYINAGTSNYQGLFGNVDTNGIIKNVGTVNSYICGNKFVGGVVGYNKGITSTCFNTGTVTGTTSVIGGVVGSAEKSVTDCYNSGKVSGGEMVGGVVGLSTTDQQISGCYNTGSVSGTESVGGVKGSGASPITNCFNTGTVTATADDSYVGGITSTCMSITNCYNSGSVSGTKYVGGISASTDVANQTITSCYNSGSVSGTKYVGGVTGNVSSGRTVKFCYNSGSVNGDTYVGGITGKNEGTISSCYYDKQMCTFGGINGGDATGQAKGKLTTDMTGTKLQDTNAANPWGANNWVFADSLYPRIKGTGFMKSDSDAAYVSAAPVLLDSANTSAVVTNAFALGGTSDGVAWASDNSSVIGVASNVPSIIDKGTAVLTATRGTVNKTVTLKVPGNVFVTIKKDGVVWTDSGYTLELCKGGAVGNEPYIHLTDTGTGIYTATVGPGSNYTIYDGSTITDFFALDLGTVQVNAGIPGTTTLNYYSVSYSGNHVSFSPKPTVILRDKGLNLTLSPDSGYTLPASISVTMVGQSSMTLVASAAEADVAGEYYYNATTGDIIIAQVNGAVSISAGLSSDAGLSTILTKTVSAGAEVGISSAPKTASISVANAVATLTAADILPTNAGATVTFYGTDSTFGTPSVASVNLTAGSGTVVYVKVTAADSTALYYAITINRAAASGSGSGSSAGSGSNGGSGSSNGGSGGSSSSSSSAAPVGGAIVIVNNSTYTAGNADNTTKNSKTVTTVTVTTDKLTNILQTQGNHVSAIIPITSGSQVAAGVLTGQMIKNMETKNATLELKTNSNTYTLPASEINIEDVSKKLGASVALSDIQVKVQIAEPSDETVKVVKNTAASNSLSIMIPAVDFSISCTNNGNTVEVSSFNSFVERTIAVPDGVNPTKITTGIVVNADGTTRHVPTKVTVVNGKYYAVINSLTNSTYAVIWHPIEFSDVAQHWAKSAVNDMGSRMVVNGVDRANYAPDRDITRAEFAAIVVRALGLAPGTGEKSFGDVAASDWYCSYIETANSYGIVNGYDAVTFGPNDKITREQAMAMIARAMKITRLEAALNDSEMATLLASYTDSADASVYAQSSVAACLKTGVVTGRSSTTVAPKDNITRAEVAVIVQRLLQKSSLI